MVNSLRSIKHICFKGCSALTTIAIIEKINYISSDFFECS
jgi:hypothetical protein